MSTRPKPAFTLVELLVALVVASLLILATSQVYSLFRRTMAQEQSQADLSQNARVALDRLSRELRQTPQIVTALPSSPTDVSVPQPSAIEFQDGHTNDLAYYSYYLSGTTLNEDVVQYTFASSPTTRVLSTATDTSGNPPQRSVISTNIIAEGVSLMNLYESADTISLSLTTTDGTQQYHVETSVGLRNG